jgi:hypothetical protein
MKHRTIDYNTVWPYEIKKQKNIFLVGKVVSCILRPLLHFFSDLTVCKLLAECDIFQGLEVHASCADFEVDCHLCSCNALVFVNHIISIKR